MTNRSQGVPIDDKELRSAILSALEESRPFSLIRLGDGEGILLGWRNLKRDDQTQHIFRTQLRKWFGRDDFPAGELDQMRGILKTSISRATVLGIAGQKPHGLWGFASRQIRSRGVIARSHLVTDVNCHARLQLSGDLKEIMLAAKSIAVVTCRSGVAEKIESLTGKPVQWIRLPEEQEVHGHPGVSDTKHWERHLFFRDQCLQCGAQLVLVGGGMLGKVYTTDAMRGGAVALDIGSVFDGWAGIGSRSYLRGNLESHQF